METFADKSKNQMFSLFSSHIWTTYIHRMRAGPKDKCRPVIVRFTNRRVRNMVYAARKELKDLSDRVYISEHLTKAASDLFFDARRMVREKKIFAAWTQNGLVHICFTSDQAARAIVVKCKADFNPKP